METIVSKWNEYWNGLNAHSVCANFELKLDLNAKNVFCPNQDKMTHRQVYVSSWIHVDVFEQ